MQKDSCSHNIFGESVLTVTGSRTIQDKDFIFTCLDHFLFTHNLTPAKLILNSGNARGVDRVAETWAKERGVEVRIYKPDWNKGKGAGLERNKEMIDCSHYCCGIWDGESRGTKHCFEYAKTKGLVVSVYIKSLEEQDQVKTG